MKVVRKVKKKTIVIDMSKDRFNPHIYEQVEYEDVLQESFFKKLMKSGTFWSCIGMILMCAYFLITMNGKWLTIYFTALLYSYILVLIYLIKKLKEKHNSENN